MIELMLLVVYEGLAQKVRRDCCQLQKAQESTTAVDSI
jgi:hypothetical protein